ncbi:MAG: AMP-binding protein [Pseudomonadota bacterium]
MVLEQTTHSNPMGLDTKQATEHDKNTADVFRKISEAWSHQPEERTLFQAILAAAKMYGQDKTVVDDPERNTLTYKRLILASLILGRQLARGTQPGEAVGVLLPNVTGLVVTLVGLNANGRVPALLNFTAGPRNIVSAVHTAPTSRVVTSRRFVETAKLSNIIDALEAAPLADGRKIQIIYLEDVRAKIGIAAKALGFIRSMRAAQFHRSTGMRPNKPAAVLFTSGTEGAPKGVVLSNRNLVGNSQQIISHADGYLSSEDTVLNPLPMFHSFGLTAGTLMPLTQGMRVVLYPSPLHYKQIPKLIRQKQATVLFATDTFLQGYARAADPDDLASVRFVVAGAERVKDTTRQLWQELGTDIQEGYGATECAPVIACNLPPINTPGSVGPFLPGIEYRLEPVEGIREGGRLFIRGPNVMLGYLYADAPGVVVPPEDGWHDTGDIVDVTDGKVIIKGRAKRFAKIGGEMVSLAAIEALAATLWPEAQHVVVNIPDPKKGEQLILVTDKPDAERRALADFARDKGFPELWIPKALMVVGAIPVLGSGKIDFPATTKMVQQARPLL